MCSKCQPFGGLWRQTPQGLRRCDCPAAGALLGSDVARRNGTASPPVMSEESALVIVEMLSGVLTYVPPVDQAFARAAIASEIQRMCPSDNEAKWLVGRMAKLYKAWPGTREMRLVYNSKFRPLDGVEVQGISSYYPEGIPSEAETAGGYLAPVEQKYLTAKGERVSAADTISNTVEMLAEAKSISNAGRQIAVPDIPVLAPGQRITAADIDAAVSANRKRIASEQLYGNEEEKAG